MKKQFLLLGLLTASLTSLAQDKVSFGVRAGVSHAGMRGDAVDNLRNLIDYSGGAITSHKTTGFFGSGSVNIPLSPQFSIEPGLGFSQKGYELKGSLNIKGADKFNAGARARLTTNYIDLPVLAKANLHGLEIFAGPQVSYLADANVNVRAGALGFNFYNNRFNATDEFNKWDVSVTGGAGYSFSNGVSLSASYDHGLSRVNSGQNIEAYNQAFKVGLGYRF